MEKKYTFEDWLENKFYNEKDYYGDYVANDSSKYHQLVLMEKMSYETLNRIQDAQAEAYEYGVKNTIELKEIGFKRKIKTSIDLKESILLEITGIEQIIEANKELYRFIIDGKTSRGIKYGATFMLPDAYINAKKNRIVDFSLPDFSCYGLDNGEGLTYFPTPEQKKYRQMEVLILWLKKLKQKIEDLNALESKQVSLNKVKTIESVNWNDLIEITMLPLIEAAEEKANPTLSAIRCAAFCEVLYYKGYIKKTKTRVKTLTEFAASRYKKDIKNSLLKAKEDDRNKHKKHSKSEQLPINKCF